MTKFMMVGRSATSRPESHSGFTSPHAGKCTCMFKFEAQKKRTEREREREREITMLLPANKSDRICQ